MQKGSASETLPQKQKQWNPHYSTPCQKFGLACLPPKKVQCLGPAHVESTGDATKRPHRGNVVAATPHLRRAS